MTEQMTAEQSPTEYGPGNWAHQALLKMDVAHALCTWASVSMPDVERYNNASKAFWDVAHMLAGERKRIEDARLSDMAAASGSVDGDVNSIDSYRDGPVWGIAQRCSYFVAPRRALLSMPQAWQQQFVDLINEANNRLGCDAFPTYSVQRRDEYGRFMHDPLAEYRHSEPLQTAATEPSHD